MNKILLIAALVLLIPWKALAVELDADNNGYQDANKGGTNAATEQDPTVDTSAEIQALIGEDVYAPFALTVSGITNMTPSATELTATSDGDTAATATTLVDADRAVVNDNGTMVQVALTDFATYMATKVQGWIEALATLDLSNVAVSFSNDMVVESSGTINGHTKSFSLTTTEGVHDGGADAAFMTDSSESLPVDGCIGMTVYNVTDGSVAPVIDNAGTTLVGTLTGGTDNNWDDGDVWKLAPGPLQSGSWWYINAATTILWPAIADYSGCVYSDGANVVKIDPQSDGMTIYLDGAALAGAGYELDSPGAAGNFICIHNRSTTKANTNGRSGTWVDGGAS